MVNDREYDYRSEYLARADDLTPEHFPALYNLSAAFVFRFLPVPVTPASPCEYVYVPFHRDSAAMEVAIFKWNISWEAGPYRQEMFRRLPRALRWIQKLRGKNIRLIPLVGSNRYPGYAPLYHLLPQRILRQFGLPVLKKGDWPTLINFGVWDEILPGDTDDRLANAFTYYIWPLLCPGSRLSAFVKAEPIRLLAHNLDYWLPYADLVAQERMRALGRVAFDDEEQAVLIARARADAPPDFVPERPLYGGYVWMGEAEARETTRQIVETADRHGHLRAIIEAVRSHRVADDFSPRWSYAKEDFERKLYRKRAKVKVTFVELNDTVPVHGPNTELEEDLLWQDFLGLLNPRERRVVVCLRSGTTKASEIATLLGYANHSPVSKALRRIRQKAEQFLDN